MSTAQKTPRTAPTGQTIWLVGRSHPLGATAVEGGVNFSLFLRGDSGVELRFFDLEDDATPSPMVRVDPARSRG